MNASHLGIEIGGTKLQVVTGDDQGTITRHWRRQVNPKEGGAGIRQQIESILEEIQQSARIERTGVGFGGPVNWRTGQICCSHQIEGWSEFQIGSWLASLTQAPVRVDNDANVAALGEALRGSGQGRNPVFYVTLGSGVGGGLIVDEKIYHGITPGESEIGHVRLDRAGTTVEERCSGWALDRRIRERMDKSPAGLLAQLAGRNRGGESRFLAPAVAAGDETACALLEELAGDLAFALSHVTHLFHPECIVLGGGLSLVGEILRAAVAAALAPCVMNAFQPGPDITLARLAEDTVPVGALLLSAA